MFKLIGCIMIIFSSVFIFSQKILESYFTYKFLTYAEDITEKVMYESTINLSYDKICRKIGFDKESYFKKAENNRYISRREYLKVKDFMDNLGKRDSQSEKQYISYNLKNIKTEKEKYYKSYCENRKVYILSGTAIGLITVIFLI